MQKKLRDLENRRARLERSLTLEVANAMQADFGVYTGHIGERDRRAAEQLRAVARMLATYRVHSNRRAFATTKLQCAA